MQRRPAMLLNWWGETAALSTFEHLTTEPDVEWIMGCLPALRTSGDEIKLMPEAYEDNLYGGHHGDRMF